MSLLPTPKQLQLQIPLSSSATQTVLHTRQVLEKSLSRLDDRLIVIIGPCSIHHPESALQYAEKLSKKIKAHRNELCIIMRGYVEKSRTSLGWKGLINDPALNNTFEIDKGLEIARHLFLQLNTAGVPVATEIIHPYVSLYLLDLISWATIGARTTESQLHREFASGLPMPVGFKNNTNGDIQSAIDAVKTARESHAFLTPDLSGVMHLAHTRGNPHAHVVLRGSKQASNYGSETIEKTTQFSPVIIDCSHGNSQKNYITQLTVANTLANRIAAGDRHIVGIMLESYLTPGKQAWDPMRPPTGDQSITDACIGWDDTDRILDRFSEAVLNRREILV